MGLLDKFNDGGSSYTVFYTSNQPNTVLATNLSPMHYYSVGQSQYFAETNDGYILYDDKTPNMLPQTSLLSFNNGGAISSEVQYILNQPQ